MASQCKASLRPCCLHNTLRHVRSLKQRRGLWRGPWPQAFQFPKVAQIAFSAFRDARSTPRLERCTAPAFETATSRPTPHLAHGQAGFPLCSWCSGILPRRSVTSTTNQRCHGNAYFILGLWPRTFVFSLGQITNRTFSLTFLEFLFGLEHKSPASPMRHRTEAYASNCFLKRCYIYPLLRFTSHLSPIC